MIKSFIKLLTRCYLLALPYGRMKLFAVLFLIFLNGLLQLVGVTSIFPFFALASDPERMRHSSLGVRFLSILPSLDNKHLLIVFGIFSIGMLLIAGIGSIFSEVIRVRYAFSYSHWLRLKVLRSYGGRPYGYFLKMNSAQLSQRILDIQAYTQFVMLPIGEALTRGMLILMLVGGILFVQPWIAIGVTLLFGGFYLMIFILIRPRMRPISRGLQLHNIGMSKRIYQYLHGIKAVLVHQKTGYFIQKTAEHSNHIGSFNSRLPLYSSGPRYLIEPIAFGGLVGVVVVLAMHDRPFSNILPNLSVIAFAGYKLLPALQLLYSQLVLMTANQYTLSQLEEEILQLESDVDSTDKSAETFTEFSFNKEIKLENLTFSYAEGVSPILKDFTLTIGKNESIGIAGPSGSGKSTLVDLLLGLHIPQSGMITIDGMPISGSKMESWRRMIGYVPQEIYLLDETIAENIAFGVPVEEIDQIALRDAAKSAQIIDFIERELPEGFQTVVGERGIRLSGGQRQRIGLARALYHKPKVLILDEATSALDQSTENSVMNTINRLHGKLTIISISHRLSTLNKCDRVISIPPKL